MPLEIIGAGWGRTGTESLKSALEILDFGKCYHMFELIKDHSRFPYWLQLEKGEKPDYEKLFDGYKSAVDFPAALYYKEFMQQFPQAKVILSVRDAEEWYASAEKTILKGIPGFILFLSKILGPINKNLKGISEANDWINRILKGETGLFQGRKDDKEFMCNLFREWNAEVIRTVPPEKLLVFEVTQGWEPLCKFLNVHVPDEPFPRSNDGKSFKKRTSKMIMKGK